MLEAMCGPDMIQCDEALGPIRYLNIIIFWDTSNTAVNSLAVLTRITEARNVINEATVLQEPSIDA